MKRLRIILKRGGISLAALLVTMFYPVASVRAADEMSSSAGQTETTSQTAPSDGEANSTLAPSAPSPSDATSSSAPVEISSPAPTAAAQQQPAEQVPPACPEVTGTRHPVGADRATYHFNTDSCLWENDYYTWNPVTKQKTRKTAFDYHYIPASDRWEKILPPATPATQAAAQPGLGGNALSADGTVQLNTNAAIFNYLLNQAFGGSVTAADNRNVGGVATGNALAVSNVMNLLQSDASFANGTVATFSADIQGDVYGDLFLDPAVLAALQGSGGSLNGDIDINAASNSLIDNDITVGAESGDALVHDNRNVGNVATGNAAAVLNLINMINSSISSGQSFMGMLNIYGNLDGDILLPPEVLNQLLASNAPPTATINTDDIENSEVLADLNSNQTISNTIYTEAAAGDALVDNNRNVGGVATGNATSNLTVLNLTGRQVTAENSLLVFVNVLGSWVGLILDAPAGTTSAALGTGVTRNGLPVTGKTAINEDSSATINNNVNLYAQSGDALVHDNRNVGNVATGNATTSANVVNIMNSSFALSDWFGILFINVFGTWHGSFGVNTEAGNIAAIGGNGAAGPTGGIQEMKAFRFVPAANGKKRLEPLRLDQQVNGANGTAVLASAITGSQGPSAAQTSSHIRQSAASAAAPQTHNLTVPAVSVLLGASLLGIERYLTLRQRHNK